MSIALGMMHGLDNALVALALGPVIGWRRGFALGALFAAAEILMPVLGASLALSYPPGGGLRAGALAVAATGIAGLALARRDPARLIRSPWAMAGLAAVLGLDNLVAGQAAPSVAESLRIGTVSAAVAVLACAAGAAAGRRLGVRAAAAAASGGFALAAAASAFS